MSVDFGSVAQAYVCGRPQYPAELFNWLASISPSNSTAWDCACGSGQATLGLASHFNHVIATDKAHSQIALAPSNPKIDYFVATAESCKTENKESDLIEDDSVDLVNVGIAAHWFDLNRFYRESLRVLKPDGILSLLVYGEPTTRDKRINMRLQQFVEMIRPYILSENKHTQALYANLPFPFLHEIEMPFFHMEAKMTVRQLANYFYSRSTIMNYIHQEGIDPVPVLERELAMLLSMPDEKMHIRWPLAGRIARISAFEKDIMTFVWDEQTVVNTQEAVPMAAFG